MFKDAMATFNIEAFDTGEGDGFKNVPQPLPQRSFCMLICGPPGTGKTNLVLNLISRAYGGEFDQIYLWSPSMDMLTGGGRAGDVARSIPTSQTYQSFAIEDLQQVLASIRGSGKKILLIFDDSVNDINSDKRAFRTALGRLCYNRRNLCGAGGHASLIITTQVFNQVPLRLRKTISHLVQHCLCPREVDEIYKTMLDVPREAYDRIVDTVWPPHDPSVRYNSLFVDLVNRRYYPIRNRQISSIPLYDAFAHTFNESLVQPPGSATMSPTAPRTAAIPAAPEYKQEILNALQDTYTHSAYPEEDDEGAESDGAENELDAPNHRGGCADEPERLRHIDAGKGPAAPATVPIGPTSTQSLPREVDRPRGSGVFWPSGRLY